MAPIPDFDYCYRAVQSRDSRFDGWFFVAVTSTGIYCRPSCSSVTPKAANVRFFPTAAAAQAAGFRACKRCAPDAAPGSPDWRIRGDAVTRAMHFIADGVVDREGVAGLAAKLGFSERQLHRHLVAEVGAGPLALARAQRAQTARLLLETTALSATEIAFAAGFRSLRQFNETVRQVFALTPTEIRQRARAPRSITPGTIQVRLAYRTPIDAAALLDFLGTRAVPGVEEYVDGVYRRSLRLPHGAGVAALSPASGHILCTLRLDDLRDLGSAVQRCRRLLDLDADPLAIDCHLKSDPVLAPLVARAPGRRVPGSVDGSELAVRAILGQQVSVAGARTLAGKLVARLGTLLTQPDGPITHLFPEPCALAEADLDGFSLTGARKSALRGLATALCEGLTLDAGVDRSEIEPRLLSLPGVGPWTAAYIAMRALGDPDAFPTTDLGIRRGFERLKLDATPTAVAARAEVWRPWRSYATVHLWSTPANGCADGTDRSTMDES